MTRQQLVPKRQIRRFDIFACEVFQPAVLWAWEDGERYEAIRDTLREPWNRELRA